MKMNMLKLLIASGLISLGAKKAYADSVRVPENVKPINIEQFHRDLISPYDSLAVKVERQLAEIQMAEAAGDTTGLRGLKERTANEAKREGALGKAVDSISDSTYAGFTSFNTAIGDSMISSGEVNNLLSRVELDPEAVNTYQKIAGQQAYARVDETVGGHNANVNNLLALATNGLTEEDQAPARTVGDQQHPKEQDRSLTDKLTYLAEAGYSTDERRSLAAGVYYNVAKDHRIGLSFEGELPERDSYSNRTLLATQRNRITGTRLEAAEDRSGSTEDYSLEVLANGQSNLGRNLHLVYGTGIGRQTTNSDSTVTTTETLYDRNDEVYGRPNEDSQSYPSSRDKLYVPLKAGLKYQFGNLGLGIQVRTREGQSIGKSGEVKGTLTLEF